MAIVDPPAPISRISAPVRSQWSSGTKASSASPAEIGSFAWQTSRSSRLDRQLVSPISRAAGSITSNRSRQASYRSILWVVTSAPRLSGSSRSQVVTSR